MSSKSSALAGTAAGGSFSKSFTVAAKIDAPEPLMSAPRSFVRSFEPDADAQAEAPGHRRRAVEGAHTVEVGKRKIVALEGHEGTERSLEGEPARSDSQAGDGLRARRRPQRAPVPRHADTRAVAPHPAELR